MPTDTDRREVARRLRAYLDTPAPWHLVDVVSDVLRDEGDYDKIQHLADLIEPSCDRDALLELADEMDEATCDNRGEMSVSLGDVWGWAICIREALGVES